MTNQQYNQSVEEIYRVAERLLSDFKNKRITYTEAIDKIEKIVEAARKEAINDCIEALPERNQLEAHIDIIAEPRRALEWHQRMGRNMYRTEAIRNLESLKRK